MGTCYVAWQSLHLCICLLLYVLYTADTAMGCICMVLLLQYICGACATNNIISLWCEWEKRLFVSVNIWTIQYPIIVSHNYWLSGNWDFSHSKTIHDKKWRHVQVGKFNWSFYRLIVSMLINIFIMNTYKSSAGSFKLWETLRESVHLSLLSYLEAHEISSSA